MVTFRVYDSASIKKEYSTYFDRYALYIPYPKWFREEVELYGVYLGFTFTDKTITKCTWEESKFGVKPLNLGKKLKRETLPQHVQNWINKLERVFNVAFENCIDNEDAWTEWEKLE